VKHQVLWVPLSLPAQQPSLLSACQPATVHYALDCVTANTRKAGIQYC
jgi:hypothetical protein